MSEQTKDGGSAFPLPMAVSTAGDLYDASQTDPGMSLRDYFAGQALTALVPGDSPDIKANYAYLLADAMLKAREVQC